MKGEIYISFSACRKHQGTVSTDGPGEMTSGLLTTLPPEITGKWRRPRHKATDIPPLTLER